MITVDQFITTHNGKSIDTDGAYGFQCMDLMHKYCQEVLGIPDLRVLAAATAKDVYLNFFSIYGHENFDRIDNTPTGIPQKGDILFWGTVVGSSGHVAVYLSGDMMNLKSFDQNWPAGASCHVQDHTYRGMLGWLRFKSTPDPSVTKVNKIRGICDNQTTAVDKLAQIKQLL